MDKVTALTPCRVPWSISATGSGLSLAHTETDIAPECSVRLGANWLTGAGSLDSREVEIVFEGCYYARVAPKSDDFDIEEAGFTIVKSKGMNSQKTVEWPPSEWVQTGICPDSGFYYATESDWMASRPIVFRRDCRHFVLSGRDGYVELIARSFKWRELSGSWSCED